MFFDERAETGERENLFRGQASRPDIERLAKLLMEHMQMMGDLQAEAFEKALDQGRERARRLPSATTR